MNKLIAKNFSNRIKNLTKDKEYTLITELDEGKYVVVENNSGNATRYSKSIFEEVVEAPPVPEPLTLEEILDSNIILDVNIEDDIFLNNITLEVPRFGPINIFIRRTVMTINESRISCGIKEVIYLNGVSEALYNGTGNVEAFNHLNAEDYKAIAAYILSILLICILYEISNGFVLFSTNINDNDYISIIKEAFTQLEERDDFGDSIITTTTYNKNSGNNIILYVVKHGEIEE